jgi:hypothetical protein
MTSQKTTMGAPDSLCEQYDGAGRCTDPAAAQQRDPLNDILVECAKMRGCYPLIHRTLHEFAWFCSAVIWGADPGLEAEAQKAEQNQNPDVASFLRERIDIEDGIKARFNREYYGYGDGHEDEELIRLAEAFRIYCQEQYLSQEDEYP